MSIKFLKLVNNIHIELRKHLGIDSFYILVYYAEKDIVEFPYPYITENGEIIYLDSRSYNPRLLPDSVIKQKSALYFNNDLRTYLENESLEYWGPKNISLPSSWIGVPIFTEDKHLGAIVVERNRKSNVFDRNSARLVEGLCSYLPSVMEKEKMYLKFELMGYERTIKWLTEELEKTKLMLSSIVSGDSRDDRRLHVFLCYSKNDKKAVRKLREALISPEFDIWLDERKLLPGQDWELEIEIAIEKADIVLVCLSKQSVSKSGYIHKEIKFALDEADKQPEGSIFLIPVRLDDCEVPRRLRKMQWVDFFSPFGKAMLDITLIVRLNQLMQNTLYNK